MFGSVFANLMTLRGKKCMIIDRRDHIAGNCYTKQVGDIHVHKYGPHIFHTNDKKIWDYVNKFTEFNNYRHRCKVNYKDHIYTFPINLTTMYEVFGNNHPVKLIIPKEVPNNLEDWAIANVGRKLYNIFIKGYTTKQWGKDPKELPASIIRRIPIRTNHNDFYFNDDYQGIPKHGYTEMFTRMQIGVDVELGVDYFEDQSKWDAMADKTIYTGAIDEFFNYSEGILDWRSLKFIEKTLSVKDHQGIAIVNYTQEDIPHTRIVEHKHFTCPDSAQDTIITKEFPLKWTPGKERYYPINDEKNNTLYRTYKQMIDTSKYIFGGRLAQYKYYDMHQVIASAMTAIKKELK